MARGSGAKVPGRDRSEPTEPAGETAPPIVLGGQPSALLALPKGRYFLLFTLPLLTSICPAFYSYIFVTMFLSY